MYNKMAFDNNKFLTGKCLIAAPDMKDERFANALVYICSHDRQGAMGFVVNKKLQDFLPLAFYNFSILNSQSKISRF